MNDHYDVIIIGTGAGGGTLLNKLAPSGKRITIIANALRVGDHLLERLEAKKAANKVGDSHSARSNAELAIAK